MAEQFAGKAAKVGKVNVYQAQNTAARYGINTIPKVLLFIPGGEIRQIMVSPGDREASVAVMARAIQEAMPQ